jgi:hypothetical protein
LAAWAQSYAESGWPVFPIAGLHRVDGVVRCRCGHTCDSPGKHPHRFAAHGFKHATTDVAKVTDWWEHDPLANIGLRCGDVFDVLDVDHDDFVTGVADLPDCETDGGPVVLTGSRRFHLYFAATGIGRKIRFSRHCDWLGSGGYVVAPPSRHITGGRYEWFAPFELALTTPPQQLLDVLAPPVRYSTPTRSTRSTRDTRATSRRGWSPHGLFGRMATAAEGERNTMLHWCAARIGDDVRAGRADEHDAYDALDQLHAVAVRAGLDDREIDRTIRSGFRGGH